MIHLTPWIWYAYLIVSWGSSLAGILGMWSMYRCACKYRAKWIKAEAHACYLEATLPKSSE